MMIMKMIVTHLIFGLWTANFMLAELGRTGAYRLSRVQSCLNRVPLASKEFQEKYLGILQALRAVWFWQEIGPLANEHLATLWFPPSEEKGKRIPIFYRNSSQSFLEGNCTQAQLCSLEIREKQAIEEAGNMELLQSQRWTQMYRRKNLTGSKLEHEKMATSFKWILNEIRKIAVTQRALGMGKRPWPQQWPFVLLEALSVCKKSRWTFVWISMNERSCICRHFAYRVDFKIISFGCFCVAFA